MDNKYEKKITISDNFFRFKSKVSCQFFNQLHIQNFHHKLQPMLKISLYFRFAIPATQEKF